MLSNFHLFFFYLETKTPNIHSVEIYFYISKVSYLDEKKPEFVKDKKIAIVCFDDFS